MFRRRQCSGPGIVVLVSAAFLAFPSVAGAANTPPVAVADAVETHARRGVLIDLLANDRDVDGDPLSVAVAAPTLGEVVDHGDGTVTYTPDPDLFENSGGESFSYTVSDGRGGSSGATVTVVEIPVPTDRQPVADPVVLLDEDFDDGDMNGWTIVDHPSSIYGPSSWSATWGWAGQLSNIGRPGTWAVYSGGSAWADYRVGATFWTWDNDAIGVVFRYRDQDNYYAFNWSNYFDKREVYKRQDGAKIVLASSPGTRRAHDPYRVDITVEGPRIQVRVDGELLFDVLDSTHSTGTVGLLSGHNTSAYFDDIRVTSVESFPLLLEDDFNDGDYAGWVIADAGQRNFPSSWQVTSGELAQTSNIWDSPFGGAALGGAGGNAIYGAGHHWTDYHFRVKLRGNDNDGILLLFRFQDLQNFYFFFWNAELGWRRLGKKVQGQSTELARNNDWYVTGYDYLMDVTVNGAHIEVRLDGNLLFSVDDDSLSSGTVGLACEGMAGVYFDNVKVTAIP